MQTHLPLPDESLRQRSRQLQCHIAGQIQAGGGNISLGSFMQSALYEPGLGYYSSGLQKFGQAGDFVTAPELGSVFARCLATSIARVLKQLAAPIVIEVGAGSGQLAYDLLLELQYRDCLPTTYQILEVSADLQARQEDLLATLPPAITGRIQWLTALPQQPFDGVVFGNEVVDALPVERFTVMEDDQILMDTIGIEQGVLAIGNKAATPALAHAVNQLRSQVQEAWPRPYTNDIRLQLNQWLADVAGQCQRGALILIDYGSDRNEIYQAERNGGSLLCHYRHRAHDQLLFWPGLQDITAWVDFSALADAAMDQHWKLDGYLTQAHWLLDAGLEQVVSTRFNEANDLQRLQIAKEVKTLTLPGEMGERFKVICFSRELKMPMLTGSQPGLERRL